MYSNAQQTVKLLYVDGYSAIDNFVDVHGRNEVQAAISNRYFLLFIGSIIQKLSHQNNLTALQNVS